MNDEITFDQEAVNEYHDYQDHRAQAIALLNKLKARETVAVSKVFWKDGQPTLVESTSKMNWDARITKLGFGRPENKGLPATDTHPRIPATWEARMDKKRRRQFTLEETPTMQFAKSSMLGPEYYVDEDALEAYINSLENEDNATTTD